MITAWRACSAPPNVSSITMVVSGTAVGDLLCAPDGLVGNALDRVDEWHESERRCFTHHGQHERAVGLHALKSSVDAHSDQAELVPHASELGDASGAVQRLDDSERGREAVRIRVRGRGDTVIDASRIGNTIGS